MFSNSGGSQHRSQNMQVGDYLCLDSGVAKEADLGLERRRLALRTAPWALRYPVLTKVKS